MRRDETRRQERLSVATSVVSGVWCRPLASNCASSDHLLTYSSFSFYHFPSCVCSSGTGLTDAAGACLSPSLSLAREAACQLIESGVWALFGPQSASVGWLVRSIADNLHIPDFQFSWDFRSYHRHRTFPSNMTINLHPEPSSLSQAIADLVDSRKWKSFALIYEKEEDLIKVLCLSHCCCDHVTNVTWSACLVILTRTRACMRASRCTCSLILIIVLSIPV